MTELLCVRHGQTDWNLEGRFQGQANPPLNTAGRAEAMKLSRLLASESLHAIYTSDLERAVETARIIGERHALTVRALRSLREADVGEFTGLTGREISERFPHAASRISRYGFAFAVGEGYDAVATARPKGVAGDRRPASTPIGACCDARRASPSRHGACRRTPPDRASQAASGGR